MGKLFTLKSWLTVPEAANHLSIVLGEEVTEADVLRLALDKHLRLSVNFVNHAIAKRGKITPISEPKLRIFSEECGPEHVVLEVPLDAASLWEFENKTVTIEGVWDLPMIGNEELDVEHKYQHLTNGPPVTLQGLDGAFVEGDNGLFCQLQEDFDDDEYQAGSTAQLKKLKQHIVDKNIGAVLAEEQLNNYKENRKDFLEKRGLQDNANRYYPAGSLPNDSVLVVRTSELRKFEQSLSCEPRAKTKSAQTKERRTLLIIIAALCKPAKVDYTKSDSTRKIQQTLEEIGVSLDDKTIRDALNEIPDALEARMK